MPNGIEKALMDAGIILAAVMKTYTITGIGMDGQEYAIGWDAEKNKANKSETDK